MKKISLYLLGMALLASCASIKAPLGGEKDTTPPRIDSTSVFTPNFQTNFKEKAIILPFDEWVVLNDVLNQVVISPPLAKPVDMKLKKRTVVIDFSEEALRPNTTYTINFGESIKDLNEGNFQKNFRYIFSTGDKIDSLEVSGKVIDALTQLPIADVLVLLYDDLTDSVVHKERPYYFAKTVENGQFTIPFVKQDTFKILALKDENANYKYDLPNEQIAFLNETIITGDTILDNPILQFFTAKPIVKAFRPKSPHYGYIPIIFTAKNLENVKIQVLEPIENLKTMTYADNDTLKFWYENTALDSLKFIVFDNETLQDTFTVKLNTKANYLKSKPQMRTKIPKIIPQNNPDRPIEVVFNHPIGQIDTARLVLLEDTLKKQVQPTVSIDVLRPNVLKINYKWKENKPYQLLLPDLTVFDFHQIGNDTIVLNYLIKERKTFGNLTATAEGLDPETAYIIQILTKDNQVIEEFYTKGKAIASEKFLSLPAQEYKLRLIIDDNDNQRWDTGSYPTSQPERVVISDTLTNLRENWELDLKILLNAE